MPRVLLIALLTPLLGACAPEPGSPRWCEKMGDTPAGEWSINDTAEYAQSCVFAPAEE